MKIQSALAMTMALGLLGGACSNGASGTPKPGNGTGGSTGAGGSSSNGTGGSSTGAGGSGTQPGACTNVTGCGGSIVGTYTASAPCLKVDGPLDISKVGLDPNACKGPTISGTLSVSGSFSAKATTFTDGTTTTGNLTFQLPAGCLNLSGTTVLCEGINAPLRGGLGLESANCQPAATGGGCTCTGVVNHKGSMGYLTANPQEDGNYATSGNTLTLAVGIEDAPYAYCAAGGTVTVTPQSTEYPTSGTIVLSASTGAGGSGNSGGSGNTGGSGNVGGSGPSTGGSNSVGGSSTGGSGSGGAPSTGTEGPCDIYAAGTTPCVAAYSTIRRINSKYTGPLYKVRNGSSAKNTGSGGMEKDIPQTADGFADTSVQDTFCSGSICTFSLLYDQSGSGNNLPVAKKGNTAGGSTGGEDDYESSATKGSLMVNGHKVYSLYMAAHEGYRLQAVGKNMPRGTASQGVYELADGTHVGTACCWDFGNVTTNPVQYGVMNTLFFGNAFWGKGAGEGPWFMADFEAGVWAGGSKNGDPGWGGIGQTITANPANPSLKVKYAFGILKTSTSKWALRMVDAGTTGALTTAYEGGMPKDMDNLGGIVLGVGGDNSNNSYGTFYEGAIVAGYPTTATDDAVLKNVRAANYGK